MSINPSPPPSPSNIPPPPSYSASTRVEQGRRRAGQRNRRRNINVIRHEILRNHSGPMTNLTRAVLNEFHNERNFELFRVVINRNCCNRELKLLVSRGTLIISAILMTLSSLAGLLIMRLYLI